MAEVGAFCAVGIMIFASVVMMEEGFLKVKASLLDFFTDDGEVGEAEGGAIRFHELNEVDTVEVKLIVNDFKAVLGPLHT
jgi:hypothetical protein